MVPSACMRDFRLNQRGMLGSGDTYSAAAQDIHQNNQRAEGTQAKAAMETLIRPLSQLVRGTCPFPWPLPDTHILQQPYFAPGTRVITLRMVACGLQGHLHSPGQREPPIWARRPRP